MYIYSTVVYLTLIPDDSLSNITMVLTSSWKIIRQKSTMVEHCGISVAMKQYLFLKD